MFPTVQKHFDRVWRKPGFAPDGQKGRDLGNATHIIMQHLDHTNCGSVSAIKQQIDRLCQDGFITIQQADLVQPEKIYAFFISEFGRKLCASKQVLREFKFSILDDGGNYGENLTGEQVLLQGVVDCALLEPDGITIVDFKTDYVREDTLKDVVARYRMQVQTYADALQRIYQQPVKARYLYLFCLDRFVDV